MNQPKSKVVTNALPASSNKDEERVFGYFKKFISMAEFGHALRSFMNPKKVPGLPQTLAINPQIINVAYARETWEADYQPQASDWVVERDQKLPIGLLMEESKIITYAPFALPTLLPKRMIWMVEFMPVNTNAEEEEAEEEVSAALRFRYRCGETKWTELVSEPVQLKMEEPVRFGFEIPLGSVHMSSLFECLMGVTPMGKTPVIVRAAWMSVAAFQ